MIVILFTRDLLDKMTHCTCNGDTHAQGGSAAAAAATFTPAKATTPAAQPNLSRGTKVKVHVRFSVVEAVGQFG